MATGKLAIRCVFADNSKETITINNINPEVGVNQRIKSIIMDFNDQQGGTLANKMVSKLGFNWIGIDQAKYTVTTREYIFTNE